MFWPLYSPVLPWAIARRSPTLRAVYTVKRFGTGRIGDAPDIGVVFVYRPCRQLAAVRRHPRFEENTIGCPKVV